MLIKFLRLAVLCFAFVLVFLPHAITNAASSDKSWYFSSWDDDITINKDSSFVVRESQTFNFSGNFHYVTRSIKKQKLDKITDIHVYDKDSGTELSGSDIEISDEPDQVTIKLNFDLTDTEKTWIFQYTVVGSIGYFDEHDELYWNVISNDRDVEIQQVSATVHLPETADINKLNATAYGSGGKNPSATIIDGRTFSYKSVATMPAQSDFTIVAGWPRGIVTNPGILKIFSKPDKANITIDGIDSTYETDAILKVGTHVQQGTHDISIEKFGFVSREESVSIQPGDTKTLTLTLEETGWYKILSTIIIMLALLWFASPIGVLVYLVRKWKRFGKDPQTKTGHTIIAQYDPPDNITPSEMGTLVKEKATIKEIIPALIDLAYRGYVKIIETQGGMIFKKQQFEFEKRKEFDANLKEHERLLLEGFFGNKQIGERVSQKDLENKFYKDIPGIQKALDQEVVARGYFAKSPEKVRNTYLAIGIVLIVIGSFGAILYALGVPLIIDGLLCILFAQAMPARTMQGRLAYEHALGFKEYLYTAERFRVQNLTPELFEKFLSYAMIFGIEKEWGKKFENLGDIKPEWYENTSGTGIAHGFAIASFTNSMSSLGTSVAASASTSPSSSASGGSGFGGGAGGGGGGGGSSAG